VGFIFEKETLNSQCITAWLSWVLSGRSHLSSAGQNISVLMGDLTVETASQVTFSALWG
jgi:hypothetical protein